MTGKLLGMLTFHVKHSLYFFDDRDGCMNRLIGTVWIASLSAAVLTAEAADDGRYTYTHPVSVKSVAERAKIHKLIPLGQALFKQGVRIPVYGVTIENPLQDGLLDDYEPCGPKSCHFDFTIKPEQAKQLVLYWVHGVGPFLAPRTWTTIEASMGPSGIAAAMMANADGSQALSVYNTSACVGCSLSAASRYFPEARKEALSNEFMVYKGSNVPVTQVALNRQGVAFSYQLPGHYPTHGMAHFYGMQQDIVNYNQMTVSLKPEDKALASTILNFYHWFHRSL